MMLMVIGAMIAAVIVILGMVITMICYAEWEIVPRTAPFDVIIFMGMVLSPIIVPIVGPYVVCRLLKEPILKPCKWIYRKVDEFFHEDEKRYREAVEEYEKGMQAIQNLRETEWHKHEEDRELKVDGDELYHYRLGMGR